MYIHFIISVTTLLFTAYTTLITGKISGFAKRGVILKLHLNIVTLTTINNAITYLFVIWNGNSAHLFVYPITNK